MTILVTQAWVRSSKVGCFLASGMTVIGGLPLALDSQPKRSQKPQYWHCPNTEPPGLV